MVGSELPKPDTSRVDGHRQGRARRRRAHRRSRTARAVLDHVSLTVHRGEVVGIAGVEGNGQRELVEAHHRPPSAVERRITLAGDDITHAEHRCSDESTESGTSPRTANTTACCCRRRSGRTACSAIRPKRPSRGRLDRPAGARERTKEIIEEFDVRTPSVDVSAYALSGGNQQKLIVGSGDDGRAQAAHRAHPTRGIDVGAQAAVWESIRRPGGRAWRCC